MSVEIIDKLKKVSLFEALANEPQALESVASLMEVRTVHQSHNIVTEGDEGDEMFVLYKGTVEICKNTLDKEMYTVVRLTAEQNAFFGELALVDNDRRSATVIAVTDCELLVMKKAKFEAFGDQNPIMGLVITRKISHILGQRLRRANQDMITLYEALVGEIEART